jgi:hypothetical protein
MNRPFSNIAVLILLAVAVLHAARLAFGWSATLAGAEIPVAVSVAGLGIALALAIGLWFEARMHARMATANAAAATRGAPASRAPGKKFTVRKGKRYRATIALGFLEQMASNDTIAGMFRDVGFEDVDVTGGGSRRLAEGLWPGDDTTAEMPSQIVSAVEIEGVAAPTQMASAASLRGRTGNRASSKQFTVRKGMRYRATIVLGFFEQVASNETIAGMFRDVGFEEVEVTGSGGRRFAEGVWPGEDSTAAMPSQIVAADEIGPAVVAAAAPSSEPPAPRPPELGPV